MQEKLYATPCGKIHYWVNRDCGPEAITLVFLPGLTADHRLFGKASLLHVATPKNRFIQVLYRLTPTYSGHSIH